ncbi:unnamed protein product [Caenorhabditis auriculariae]|uniref:Phosphoglycerate mutase family protein n=1 Tax=Caenorhabditis auriculariae TaxID=2777116 RepID=A0A8S1HHH0_9PELO|nr:unnamed protein product [Caenorhabditis auriculariae]
MDRRLSSPDDCSQVGSFHCTSNFSNRNIKTDHYERDVKPSKLLVMRHSERVDDCFPGWIEKSNVGGNYVPYDLNMPSRLPVQRPLREFINDTPLTRSGIVIAQMVGRGILMADVVPDIIYCSPALRCLQTATWVREICGSKGLLRVEPGLFENCTLYPDGSPIFVSPIQRLAFPVDKSYRPIYRQDNLFKGKEVIEAYNDRLRDTLEAIAEQSEIVTGNKKLTILVVGHASTVDMSVGLLREKPRYSTEDDLFEISVPVPYCSIALLQRKKMGAGWEPNPFVVPPITYENYTNKYNSHFVNRA